MSDRLLACADWASTSLWRCWRVETASRRPDRTNWHCCDVSVICLCFIGLTRKNPTAFYLLWPSISLGFHPPFSGEQSHQPPSQQLQDCRAAGWVQGGRSQRRPYPFFFPVSLKTKKTMTKYPFTPTVQTPAWWWSCWVQTWGAGSSAAANRVCRHLQSGGFWHKYKQPVQTHLIKSQTLITEDNRVSNVCFIPLFRFCRVSTTCTLAARSSTPTSNQKTSCCVRQKTAGLPILGIRQNAWVCSSTQ